MGRVDEANADIEQALSLDPNYSDAYALQSIIAVVQNEKEKALDLANKAVQTGPKSATALIALSYAQQASFNLEGARASLEQAVKVEPENALAWARLAEMWSSFGYLDKSLAAAQAGDFPGSGSGKDPDGAGLCLPHAGQNHGGKSRL